MSTIHHPSRARRAAALVGTLGLAAGLLLGACSDDDDAGDVATDTSAAETESGSGSATVGEISIDGAWARSSPMVASAGAAYMEITNEGDEDDALVGASVPTSVAGTTELHETRAADGDMAEDEGAMDGSEGDMPADEETTASTEGDMAEGDDSSTTSPMMEMVPVERIEVPAGETATLEPGGYHVMLLDLVEPLEDGQEVEITLTFEVAGEVTVTAVVGDSAP